MVIVFPTKGLEEMVRHLYLCFSTFLILSQEQKFQSLKISAIALSDD